MAIITKERQKAFEASTRRGGEVPHLCGYYGRACRHMEKEEGANRALCMGCPLSEFCEQEESEESGASQQGNTVYDMEAWKKDGNFAAEPGREISEDAYNYLLDCMPPLSLPRMKAKQALHAYNIPVHKGFLMGEPHSHDENGALYLAFGMNDYGSSVNKKEPHYYYLGLSHEAPTLNGTYYFFDCMNAFITDRYWETSAFKDVSEAISMAADYEASLYMYEYKNGERVSRGTLYEPQF